jgi:hypothetical protein
MVYFPYEVHVLRLYLNVNLMLLRLLHITLQEHKISFVRFQQYTQIATMIINTTSPPNEPPTIDISSSRLTMMF